MHWNLTALCETFSNSVLRIGVWPEINISHENELESGDVFSQALPAAQSTFMSSSPQPRLGSRLLPNFKLA